MPVLKILLVAATLFFALLWGIYRFAFGVKRVHPENAHNIPNGEQYRPERARMTKMIDDMLAVPCDRVSITSRDGLTLSARYYHIADGAPVEIELHGYRGSAIRDFCGGNRLSREAGRNMLLIDQRGNGESGGRAITFGVKERYDCLDWIGYVLKRFGPDTKILISGISMGAATALMVAGMEELPANVVGVVADCPFTSPREIICKVGRDLHLPMKILYPLVRLGARLFGGFDPDSVSAVEGVRHARVPVLLMHGDDDRFVPCDMSRELYRNCTTECTLLVTPKAGHGLSFILDEAAYTRATSEFARKLGV